MSLAKVPFLALVRYSWLVVTIFTIGYAILRNALGLGNLSTSKCDSMLEEGRWSHDYDSFPGTTAWHPFGCRMHSHNPVSARKCLANKTVFFLGDSTSRTVFWAFAAKLDPERAYNASLLAKKHVDIFFESDDAARLEFIWDPYLNATASTIALQDLQAQSSIPSPGIVDTKAVIIGTGMWHVRYLNDMYAKAYSSTLRQLREVLELAPDKLIMPATSNSSPLPKQPLYLIPPTVPDQHRLDQDRGSTMTSDRLHDLHQVLWKFQQRYGPYVAWNVLHMTKFPKSTLRKDGLHVSEEVATHLADTFLYHLCPHELSKAKSETFADCCSTDWRPTWSTTKILLVHLWLLVITIGISRSAAASKKSARDTFRALGVVFLVLTYCYVADRTPLLSKSAKITDVRPFTAFCLLFALVAIWVGHSEHGQPAQPPKSRATLLPREHTEEWKGWMQAVILLYHYFGMSQIFWVYRVVRVLVGSYLFLTGYGHATYFLTTQDYSLRRSVTVLLRLNLLPCLLSMIMNKPYDFYYFPGLASLWYLITYMTLWTLTSEGLRLRYTLLRIVISATLLGICLTQSQVRPLVSLLNTIHGPSIDLRELLFRVRLDMVAPYLGMALAAAIHSTSLPQKGAVRSQNVESAPWHWMRGVGSMVVVLSYFALTSTFGDKFAYNVWHPILSTIPILVYMYCRNSAPYLASSVSNIATWLGKCSLETYVLQYHIWLADDTKGLLRLGVVDIPRFSGQTTLSSWAFWLESATLTITFLGAAHECAKATNIVVSRFVGDAEVNLKATEATLPSRTGSGSFWLHSIGKGSPASVMLAIKTAVLLASLWILRNV